MSIYLGKKLLFGLLSVTIVNVYDFVCVLLSVLVLRMGGGFDSWSLTF